MKKYLSIIAVLLAVGSSSCKKDYLSLEVNPNSPSVSTPQLTLSGAESTTAAIIVNDYAHYGVWGGYWTQSGNYVPSPQLQQFQFTNTSYNGAWNDLYANAVNYNTLQTQATADATLANYQAIAIIMKAFDFQQLVDNFNDVPYTQAFNSSILFPAYDKGAAIYADLFKQLDNAISIINKSGSAASPGSGDIIFGGDMTKWKKFANTLKLRLAIRQSNIAAPSSFTAELTSTATEGYLDETVQATANPGYANLAGKQNPFYGNYGFDASGNATGNNAYYRASDFSVKLLNSYSDPRVSRLYAATPSGAIRGNIFGDTKNSQSNATTSAIGPGLLQSATQNSVIFSGAQSLFLQSEAVRSGYLPASAFGATDAKSLYQRGISASFVALGLTAAQATTYFTATASGNYDNNPQQATIIQKWISLNGYNNLEAYNEYRRTGYPALPASADPASISATLPTRVYYPLSEQSTNGTNLAAEGTINPFTSKIFWAK